MFHFGLRKLERYNSMQLLHGELLLFQPTDVTDRQTDTSLQWPKMLLFLSLMPKLLQGMFVRRVTGVVARAGSGSCGFLLE